MKYEIGTRIRKFRERQGLSQKEFAKLIGVSNARVSNWEQGLNRPDVDILASICNVLRVDPNELLDIRLNKDGLSEEEKQIIKQNSKTFSFQNPCGILREKVFLSV